MANRSSGTSSPKINTMRLFEALNILNMSDEEEKTDNVGICSEVVSVNRNGETGTVTVGVPAHIAQDLALGTNNRKALLVIVKMDEYKKVNPD